MSRVLCFRQPRRVSSSDIAHLLCSIFFLARRMKRISDTEGREIGESRGTRSRLLGTDKKAGGTWTFVGVFTVHQPERRRTIILA